MVATGRRADRAGTYRCGHADCGKTIQVREGEVMPPCPQCGRSTSWTPSA